MIEKILSPVCYEIWKMLDHPEDWRHGSFYDDNGNPHTIVHNETHICLWVCNGSWFLNGYDTTIFSYDERGIVEERLFRTKVPHIGRLDRHILWRKVKKVLDNLEPFGKHSAEQLLYDLRQYNENRYLNDEQSKTI